MTQVDSKWTTFALRPLAKTLFSNTISVRNYVPGKGFEGHAERTFTSIDIAVWAHGFLEAMDHFMHTVPADSEHIQPGMERVLRVKSDLCAAIPAALVPVHPLEPSDTHLSIARSALKKALGNSLSGGYALPAVHVSSAVSEVAVSRAGTDLFERGGTERKVPDLSAGPTRVYPAVPTLVDQSVIITCPETDVPGEVTQCRYSLSLLNTATLHDTVWIRLRYAAPTILSTGNTVETFFQSLAQFHDVYPLLCEDLAVLAESSTAPVPAFAIAAFAEMAEAVAAAWPTQFDAPVPDAVSISGTEYGFTKIAAVSDADHIASYTMNVAGSMVEDDALPIVFVKDVNGKYEQLVIKKISDSQYSYDYKGANKSNGGEMIVELPCTDIFALQPAFETYMTRNSFSDISRAFAYKTPSISFADPMGPFIDNTEPFHIDTGETPLGDALASFFASLTGDIAEQPEAKIAVSCTIPLGDDAEGVSTTVPVTLVPFEQLSADTATKLAEAIMNWNDVMKPAPESYFVMEVTLFNKVGAPVVLLHDVRFTIKQAE